MHFLYSTVLWLATPFILAYHLFRSFSRGRPAALAERFGVIPAAELAILGGPGAIWVHAVSVGETMAARPLLKALKERFPGRKLVLSNVTETGRSIARGIPEVDLAIYFPFDYGFAMTRVLRALQPALVVVVETEIWPSLLRAAGRRGVPVVLANGRISDRSFPRYRRLRRFFREALAGFSALGMQSDEDGRRIVAIGAEPDRVRVTGNLKYDVPSRTVPAEEVAELRRRFALPMGGAVLVAGSTHAGEEEQVLAAFGTLCSQGREVTLVLVPRHPERAGEVAALLRREGLVHRLRSALAGGEAPLPAGGVLLVDTVGELMALYALADLVFVGGSLVPTGGHNLLEPASLGKPVLFGPHTSNFREVAARILASGGGIQVSDGDELAATLAVLLDDPDRCRTLGNGGLRLLAENGGATDRTVALLAPYLGEG